MNLVEATDAPLNQQLLALEAALASSPVVTAILERLPLLDLPNCYLGAGAITGTVWNLLHEFDPSYGIKDYDLIYFDPGDLSDRGEKATKTQAAEMLTDVTDALDVTNEARVHLWYPSRFGRTIPPYRSSEHAISTWPTTASSIGVGVDGDSLRVCAPFGLRDLFAMVIRPNKTIIDEHVYVEKAVRWGDLWPLLRVQPWPP